MRELDLGVWLSGALVATIDQDRRGPRLTYTPEAIRLHGLGTPLLSLSLPVRAERFTQGSVRPFLDGLLPEGEARRIIARDLKVDPDDTVELIALLGRECAGALIIQPLDDDRPPGMTTSTAEPLSDEELANLVANLRSAPLGVGGRVRVSLAGVQEKLVLTRMVDGGWGRPVDGTPSTHILKPEIAAYPNTVENEAFCMRIAKHLGLEVAEVETIEVAGRKLLVAERFDRLVGPDGTVERIHQEDFCQATGMRPVDKYEEDGGPSLSRIAAIVAAVSIRGSLERLFQSVLLNVVCGNGDAHAKNYSVLHGRAGAVRLSPLYDVMCTLAFGDDRLAMYIDDVRRTDRVTTERLVNEGVRWGLTRRRCVELAATMLDGAPAAIQMARQETDGVPDPVLSAIERQLARLNAP